MLPRNLSTPYGQWPPLSTLFVAGGHPCPPFLSTPFWQGVATSTSRKMALATPGHPFLATFSFRVAFTGGRGVISAPRTNSMEKGVDRGGQGGQAYRESLTISSRSGKIATMDTKVVTVKVLAKTRQKLKLLAAFLGVSMQEAAEVAIDEKLEEVKKETKEQ
jgi:hypothetical protein